MQPTMENTQEVQPQSPPLPVKAVTATDKAAKQVIIPVHRQDEIGAYYNDPMGR